jgi:hypothetical protein
MAESISWGYITLFLLHFLCQNYFNFSNTLSSIFQDNYILIKILHYIL